MSSDAELVRYYARRAREYEDIYARPERQDDLRALEHLIADAFEGRRVLELACGTGYFTAHAARKAAAVTALDINPETLAIARAKGLTNVAFEQGDAYAPARPGRFDGALATFWWSHVPMQRMEVFLAGVQASVIPDAVVLFADNTFVPGNSSPLARRDPAGNTYQWRTLANGERYEVLKNFPSAAELQAWGERFGTAVEVVSLRYYWILRYRSRSAAAAPRRPL